MRNPVDVVVGVALAAAAAALRVAPLAPPNLWLDDSWPTLVVKADTLHEVLLAGAWAPGFIVLLKGWLAAFGFSELTAQLLPFLLGVAAPPLLYFLLVRRGLSRPAAGAGAFVLLTSSVHIAYSARVKQYTLDAICVIVLVAVLWWLLENPTDKRRWWWLALTAAVAIGLSSLAAVVAGSGVVVALLVLLREERRSLPVALPPAALLALFSGAWWWLVLRPRVTTTLREGFHARFFGIDEGLGSAVRDLADASVVIVRGAVHLPGATEAFVVLAAVGVVLWRRPRLGMLLLAPLALAVVLAALGAAPLGTGRTDIYLYPLLAALVAVAAHEALAHFPRVTTLASVALAAASLATYQTAHYPQEVVRPLVEEIEMNAAGRDAVLVSPKARYAFALYTSWPVNLVESSDFQTGFSIRVRRPNVFVLETSGAAPVGKTVDRISAGYESAWVLASHGSVPQLVDRLLAGHGYVEVSMRREPGASLAHWSRGS